MEAQIVNRDALGSYVERIERLHEERATLNADLKEVYGQAKNAGFDVTTLREIVRERQMDEEARHSRYALLDSYRAALGMLADTPLGAAAMERVEVEYPAKSFAEQPVHEPRRRGRPRRATVDDALGRARAHLAH
jgi:uncharacterized protein (UPF0335 family)